MKNKLDIVEKILIYILIVVCSYQGIFANINSFLDEILLFSFFAYELFSKKINRIITKKSILLFLIFISLTLINVFLKRYEPTAYAIEILNYLKIPLILFLPSLLNLDDKEYKKILSFFIFVNIISAIVGIYHFTFYNKIGYRLGDKFRNGLYRPVGLSGHPISMGFACLISILMIHEKKSFSKYNLIMFILENAIFIYALYLTQDRLPLLLLLIYFSIIVIKKAISKIKDGSKTILPLLVVIMLFMLTIIGLCGYDYIKDYMRDDMENTIRMYSLKKSGEVYSKYPILGTGIGTFGCSSADKYDSYVFDEFNIKRYENKYDISKSSSNAYESFFAKMVIEIGSLGIIYLLIIYISMIKLAFKSKSINLIFLIMCLIIYSFLNSMYQIPFILGLSIIYSKQKNKIRLVNNNE